MGDRYLRLLTGCLAVAALSACTTEPGQKLVEPPPRETEAPAPKPVAEVVRFATPDGKAPRPARYRPKDEARWRPLETGMINAGDSIASTAGTTGLLRLTCSDSLALGGDTTVTATACDRVSLRAGEVWVLRRTPPESSLTFRTDVAEVVFNKSTGSLRFDGEVLEVSMVSGAAELVHVSGKMTLRPGEAARITNQEMNRVVIKDPGGLVAWTQGIRNAIEGDQQDAPGQMTTHYRGLGTLIARIPSNKTPLPFHSLGQDVTVRIQDHMALTRVEQIFENPTARVVEGTYKFHLPDGARLTGYDMEIGGKMVQGEIVTRKRGRTIMKKVIREFLDRMRPRDPALTEWEAGNTFSTRIFPIKAREKKRIVLSYLMPLSGSGGRYRYQLPLASEVKSLPTIPRFRISASVGASGQTPTVRTPLYPATIAPSTNDVTVTFEAKQFRPRADFVIEIDHIDAPETSLATYSKKVKGSPSSASTPWWSEGATVSADGYFMLRLSPKIETTAVEAAADWIVMVDNSESRYGTEKTIETHLTGALLDAMGPDDRVKVIRFDTFAETMDDEWVRPSARVTARAVAFLNGVPPGGATNIEEALKEAERQHAGDRPLKVVLIGDGAATVGEKRPGVLGELTASLFGAKAVSLSTVGVGSSVDRLLLETLARKTGGTYSHISSGEDLYAAAVRIITTLRGTALTEAKLRFKGLPVEDVLPETLPNLPAGDSVVVTGRFRGTGKLDVILDGRLSHVPWQRTYGFEVSDPKPTNTFIPLLHAAHQLDALTLAGDEKGAQAVSKKWGIAGRHASFVVLENDAMYREFNVEKDTDRVRWTGDESIDYELPEEMDVPSDDAEALEEGEGASPIESSRKSSGAASRSAKRSKPKRAKSSGLDPWDDDWRDADSYPEPKYYAPRPRFRATVQIRREPTPENIVAVAELEAAVSADPTDRKRRRKLVNHLLRHHLLDRAVSAVTDWLLVDRSNPEPHLHAAEAAKLKGDMKTAFRHLGSIIDLKPESKDVLSLMAGYYEAHRAWNRSYPFRAALATLTKKNDRAVARRAVIAALAGEVRVARHLALSLTAPLPSGYHRLKKGVRLPKALKSPIISLAETGKLPLDFDPFGNTNRPGKVVITLNTDPSSGAALWVKKGRDHYLGGIDDNAYLTVNRDTPGKTGLAVSAGTPGTYRIQVVCEASEGCNDISGKLNIKAYGFSRSIPFAIDGNEGKEIAVLRIKRMVFRW